MFNKAKLIQKPKPPVVFLQCKYTTFKLKLDRLLMTHVLWKMNRMLTLDKMACSIKKSNPEI